MFHVLETNIFFSEVVMIMNSFNFGFSLNVFIFTFGGYFHSVQLSKLAVIFFQLFKDIPLSFGFHHFLVLKKVEYRISVTDVSFKAVTPFSLAAVIFFFYC